MAEKKAEAVYEHVLRELREKEKIHMALIDPDKQSPQEAGEKALAAARGGTSAIMVGGSTGVTHHKLGETIEAIKERVGLPVILFPSGASAITPNLDALYFMMAMNSTDPRFLVEEQAKAAPYIKKMGIETIPMGYVIVEPGMKVGEVSRARLVGRDETERAIGYALAAEMFGMKLVYLEAGSGADSPVPPDMIKAVREKLDPKIPLIVGGGIDSPEKARTVAMAGADIIVTGTLVEKVGDVEEKIREIVGALGH